MIALAEQLDALAANERLFVTEADEEVVLARVQAEIAQDLLGQFRNLGWRVRIENNANEEVLGELDAAFGPFRMTATKPSMPGRLRFLTRVGFRRWLSNTPNGMVQVASAGAPFETAAFRVGGWGDEEMFEPAQRAKSPRELVRETQQERVVPTDVRPWLISERVKPDWDDPVFMEWRSLSGLQLLRSIAAEVRAGQQFCFSGNAQLCVSEPRISFELAENTFFNLQKIVSWVYENPSETETRFRLVNYEFGRLGRSGSVDVSGVLEYVPIAYESARLAFQYSLAKVSSESAKALADLRKSLSEETSRLSDMVRQIIAAVSGALFVGIGLVAARFSTNTDPYALLAMGFVLAGYVGLVIFSGHKNLNLQRSMRTVWRNRLYGYISNDDYKAMILDAAGKSEAQFYIAARIGGAITALIVLSLLIAVAA